MALASDFKKQVISNYKLHKTDSGSPEVQVAILSQRIGLPRAGGVGSSHSVFLTWPDGSGQIWRTLHESHRIGGPGNPGHYV
ncbi:MAG: 30S ribosomal protein S15 [Acidobacteria bacterium]|nr:30S ribosomal protein S15 [Acidobacteriota bacterium]